MKFEKKHLGKWVATKGQKVVASKKSLKKLMTEVKKRDKSENIMFFQYPEFLGLTEERIFRPMIPITFKANNEVFKTYGLIDSGCDYTILPIELAGIFKLKLSDQPRYSIGAAGGSSFTVYRSPIEIECILSQRGFRDIKINSQVYFAESCETCMLGQKGFLDQLQVNLDGEKREIEIKK